MGTIASEITSLTIVYSIVYSDADQRKHQSSASLAFVWGIHRGPVNFPHKWPVTRKMFPFDDVIMNTASIAGVFVIVSTENENNEFIDSYSIANLRFNYSIILRQKEKKNVCIYYHFSTLKWYQWLASFLMEDWPVYHYYDVIMGAIASQITSLTIVHSTVYSGADHRHHQSSALPAFVRGINRSPVNSPHKWPVTRKIFPFDDVIVHTLWMSWLLKTLRRKKQP